MIYKIFSGTIFRAEHNANGALYKIETLSNF